MARKPRIEFEDAAYHVMSRGNRGANIFVDDDDRRLWLDTLGEACRRMAWEVHAYVLMGNHYHLLLVTPRANLVEGMRWFQSAFTQRINARHRWRGHLFQGRYRAQNIDPESSEGYFRTVADYIHLNPARAGIAGATQSKRRKTLAAYPWSSLPLYLGKKSARPPWLEVESVFVEHSLRDDARGRRQYGELIQDIATNETGRGEEEGRVRSGWYLGAQRFRERLLDRLEAASAQVKRKRASVSGEAVRHVDEREAARLLFEGKRLLQITGMRLDRLPKNDMRKQALAWMIRTQTSVPAAWVCERLQMGHVANVSRAVKRMRERADLQACQMLRRLAPISICKD